MQILEILSVGRIKYKTHTRGRRGDEVFRCPPYELFQGGHVRLVMPYKVSRQRDGRF